MTKPNFIEIVVVLDRSGSMGTVRSDTIGGFNTFVSDQKSNAVGEIKLSLIQFDDQYEVVYNGKQINEVPLLTEETFVPRGMTALFDAVGKSINTVGERLAKTPEMERPSLVVFVILTDGQENASKEFKLEQAKEMITHQKEKYGWQFVFLGADQDAFQAAQMGLSANSTYNYTSANTIGTYTTLSRAISHIGDVMVTCDSATAGVAAANLGDLMRDQDEDAKKFVAKTVANNSAGTI